MKKIILFLSIILVSTACSDDFLDRYPKGRWHHGNYTPDNEIDNSILVEAKIAQTYATLRNYGFIFSAFGMQNYTTPDVEKGSTPSDGQQIVQFKPMSYTASNNQIADYYSSCYNSIYLANEALALAQTIEGNEAQKNTYIAEGLFLRSVMYFRLTQAFGGVPYVDKVLGQAEKTPPRMPREEIWRNLERDLISTIPLLPTRMQLKSTSNEGRATQNAARVIGQNLSIPAKLVGRTWSNFSNNRLGRQQFKYAIRQDVYRSL